MKDKPHYKKIRLIFDILIPKNVSKNKVIINTEPESCCMVLAENDEFALWVEKVEKKIINIKKINKAANHFFKGEV